MTSELEDTCGRLHVAEQAGRARRRGMGPHNSCQTLMFVESAEVETSHDSIITPAEMLLCYRRARLLRAKTSNAGCC